jgi:hypothetical protein
MRRGAVAADDLEIGAMEAGRCETKDVGLSETIRGMKDLSRDDVGRPGFIRDELGRNRDDWPRGGDMDRDRGPRTGVFTFVAVCAVFMRSHAFPFC